MKKILFLGAARFQTPPLEYARAAGYQVFTCDNRPENYGHRLAHASYDVSTTDTEAVLRLAERLHIDGVVAFGSDVSALTAAHVSEKLGLPGPSVETVERLSQKHLFRRFLQETGLQPWEARSFERAGERAASEYCLSLGLPAVVKPVDASGSRGVTVVRRREDVSRAIAAAFREARSGIVVVERFFRKRGFQVCGDGYMEDGRLVFVSFGDGHYYDDGVHFAPFGETFPSTHEPAALEKLRGKLEAILARAGYVRGCFNLDCLVGDDGEGFVIEIGPRTGGNYLPSAIRYQTGVDLVAATVEGAWNRSFRLDASPKRADLVACFMAHSLQEGVLEAVELAPEVRPYVLEENPYLAPGEKVHPFLAGGAAVGNFILRFDDHRRMLETMSRLRGLCVCRLKAAYDQAV